MGLVYFHESERLLLDYTVDHFVDLFCRPVSRQFVVKSIGHHSSQQKDSLSFYPRWQDLAQPGNLNGFLISKWLINMNKAINDNSWGIWGLTRYNITLLASWTSCSRCARPSNLFGVVHSISEQNWGNVIDLKCIICYGLLFIRGLFMYWSAIHILSQSSRFY